MPDIGTPYSPTLGDFYDILDTEDVNNLDVPEISAFVRDRLSHAEEDLTAPPSEEMLDSVARIVALLTEWDCLDVVVELKQQMVIAIALRLRQDIGLTLREGEENPVEINFNTGGVRYNDPK